MSTQSLPYAHLGEALATDSFQIREQFTDEQWNHFITTRQLVDEEVLPAMAKPDAIGAFAVTGAFA